MLNIYKLLYSLYIFLISATKLFCLVTVNPVVVVRRAVPYKTN